MAAPARGAESAAVKVGWLTAGLGCRRGALGRRWRERRIERQQLASPAEDVIYLIYLYSKNKLANLRPDQLKILRRTIEEDLKRKTLIFNSFLPA
jgi:hypothetical protein